MQPWFAENVTDNNTPVVTNGPIPDDNFVLPPQFWWLCPWAFSQYEGGGATFVVAVCSWKDKKFVPKQQEKTNRTESVCCVVVFEPKDWVFGWRIWEWEEYQEERRNLFASHRENQCETRSFGWPHINYVCCLHLWTFSSKENTEQMKHFTWVLFLQDWQCYKNMVFLVSHDKKELDCSCGSDERHMNVLCMRNVSARQCFVYRESRKCFRLFMNSSASALFGPSVENSVVTLILPFTVT